MFSIQANRQYVPKISTWPFVLTTISPPSPITNSYYISSSKQQYHDTASPPHHNHNSHHLRFLLPTHPSFLSLDNIHQGISLSMDFVDGCVYACTHACMYADSNYPALPVSCISVSSPHLQVCRVSGMRSNVVPPRPDGGIRIGKKAVCG